MILRRLLLALCLLCVAPAARAAITHVQAGCNTENGASSSGTVACSLGSGVAAGDMVPLFVIRHTGVTSITSVVDDKSDACTVGADVTGTTIILTPVYCPNLTATAKTFTANLSSAATLATIIVVGEYAGVPASSALDKTTGQAQTTPGTGTNAVTSGSAGTATVPGELVIGGTINTTGAAGAGTLATGTGFTADQTVTNLLRGEYLIQTSPAAVAGTFTAGSALDSFVTAVMSFMPGEQSSKIVGFTVLTGTDQRSSKIVGFVVLQGAVEADSKTVGFAVLCTPPGTVACPVPPSKGGLLIDGVPF